MALLALDIFTTTGARSHLFAEPKPYFFQYHHKALKRYTIDSWLNFLLHGLLLETQEGIPVIIKSHLLRHAFATEAAQRQKLPIKILAKMLHQRDVKVTGYYSEPTTSQVAQTVSDLQDIISDYVDLDEAILRSPKELQDQWMEHHEKVGVFNNVLGGICVEDAVYPIKMQCLGCKAKIPQPEKKHQLHEVIELSKDMEKRYSLIGLDIEVKKAKAMCKHAKTELKEIDPEGKGIHSNTIRTNEQLYEYYKQHSLAYKQKENRKNVKPPLNTDIDFRKLKQNRGIENARRKYMKLSKKELVER